MAEEFFIIGFNIHDLFFEAQTRCLGKVRKKDLFSGVEEEDFFVARLAEYARSK